jgi:thymidine phosphorylase
MVHAQGGRLEDFDREFSRRPYTAAQAGWIHSFDCEKFGYAIIEMGGGRKQATDRLDYRCGLELLVEIGDPIEVGQPLLNFLDYPRPAPPVLELLRQAIQISTEPPVVSSGEAAWMLVEHKTP